MHSSKKFVRQLLACAPVFLNQFLIGVGWGWTAPMLPQLQSDQSDFKITPNEASWLGSISEVGRIIGPIVSPLLLDNIGRKNTSILVSFIYALIWIGALFIRDIHVLLAMRVVFGIGNGVTDVASSIYIAEVCSPEFRGVSGSGIVVAFFLGLIFEFFLATYTSYTTTALVNAIVAICAIASQYFAVETTYFLTLKGRHEQAMKNLIWLEADSNVEDELKKIRKNVDEERRKRASFKLLFSSKTNLKAMFGAVGFYFLFSSVGFHTVIPFAAMIFSPTESISAKEFTIMFGIVEFVSAIVSIFLTERVDRKPMIFYSFTVITACNVGTAFLLNRHAGNHPIAYYPWWLFACISLYGFVGTLIGPAVYVITGEILPLSVRAIGSSMAVSASSAGSFLTAILFWPITRSFGMEMNFVIYSGVCVAVVLFVWLTIPETRGKALYDMHKKQVTTDVELMDVELNGGSVTVTSSLLNTPTTYSS